VGYYFFGPELKASETILYLHGNGGSKYEALPLVDLIPKFNVNIVAFDFLGCGSSDSAYLTYGVKESEDVKLIV
jgi:pimeloyl-ACP methyl ester carboxylesterase